MRKINVRKRGKVYEYFFEGAKVNNKRTRISKSGFRTKNEAYLAGMKSYDEYINGKNKEEAQMSYSDYLDYWMKEYFEINYKYSTAKRYRESFEAIKKILGKYRICNITPYLLNQALLKLYQKTGNKESLRNYKKVIKSSLRDAANYFGFIEGNPAGNLQIPRVLSFELKKQNKTYLYQRTNWKNIIKISKQYNIHLCIFNSMLYRNENWRSICSNLEWYWFKK